jgi:hypothetical protein
MVGGDGGDELDLRADRELVDAVERLAVRGAVPGDRHVAALAGQRRVRVVPGAGPQRRRRGALHDHGVHADVGHDDLREGVAGLNGPGDVLLTQGRRLELVLELHLDDLVGVHVGGQGVGEHPGAGEEQQHRQGGDRPLAHRPQPEGVEEVGEAAGAARRVLTERIGHGEPA